MRVLPTTTRGGEFGRRIRRTVGDSADSVLVVFYIALFLFLVLNRRASMFLMVGTRVFKSLEYLTNQEGWRRY